MTRALLHFDHGREPFPWEHWPMSKLLCALLHVLSISMPNLIPRFKKKIVCKNYLVLCLYFAETSFETQQV